MNTHSSILITALFLFFHGLPSDGMAKGLSPENGTPPPTADSPPSEKEGSGTAGIKVKTGAKPVTLGPVLTPEKKAVNRVIRATKREIRNCYESALSKTPELKGRMTLSFTIEMDGKVSASEVKDSELANPAVERCLVALSKTWVFPKREKSATVVYPFIFNKK